MNVINISDFRNNISDFINRVIYKKESFLLRRGKSIVAKIVVYNEKQKGLKEDKIAKFAGIWDNKDGEIIEKYARKLRREAKIIPST